MAVHGLVVMASYLESTLQVRNQRVEPQCSLSVRNSVLY